MTPPAGWSIADNTPFAYSQFHTQYGGITNGAVVSWPKAIKAKGEIRNQYYHVIDVAPPVLAAAGLPQPKLVDGIPQKPIEGVSMLGSFNDAHAKSFRIGRLPAYDSEGVRWQLDQMPVPWSSSWRR